MPVTTLDPILQLGAQGNAVKELQQLVNAFVSQTHRVTVDGVFGQKTEAAIKVVQYQRLLRRDGLAGAMTWAVLRSGEVPLKPVLTRGSFGEDVAIAQTILRDGGYYKGAIDGDFGRGTEAAVRALQAERGDLAVDGAMDQETWQALAEVASILSA